MEILSIDCRHIIDTDSTQETQELPIELYTARQKVYTLSSYKLHCPKSWSPADEEELELWYQIADKERIKWFREAGIVDPVEEYNERQRRHREKNEKLKEYIKELDTYIKDKHDTKRK